MTQRCDRNALPEAAVSLALMAGAGWAMWQAWGYGTGSFRMPGPGGYPFVLSAGLFAAAALALLSPLVQLARSRRSGETRRTHPADSGAPERKHYAAMLVVVLVAWVFLFREVGFAVASVACVALVCLIGGQRSLFRAILFACILTAICYLLFVVLLGLPL